MFYRDSAQTGAAAGMVMDNFYDVPHFLSHDQCF